MFIFGRPNQVVRKYVGNRKGIKKTKLLFRFDKYGKYQTDDEKLIKFLKTKGFKVKDIDLNDINYHNLKKYASFSTHGMKKKEIIFNIKKNGEVADVIEQAQSTTD